MWYYTGWICSYVVISLKTHRPPARPRKLQALDRVPDNNALPTTFYAVDNLAATWTKSPSRFLNWCVVKGYSMDGGVPIVQGTVASWSNRKGRYVWKIEFTGRKTEAIAVEELSRMISYTHATGGIFTH
ncbi:hypothetical protein P3T76_006941 [Phytophthora citrophthora]|uniref:Uncharacterized protein n=1 Tax=Phytophthora citrophthora TaxID=4793 RepID=A0AAD9GNS7_9STRA|nr:hypothetical protein P3T76_006941 [Phytophthora citrophthora]